ncbi:myo-inositol-1(or 4)-monophosphatase 1 [Trypanosoma conorhini]|uniref:Inositol-1-monophosphatase n=1 Tax=Trypanosoma conorhini TaxID=83891 RepID=A0A3R7M7T1_9TRYP|nr:myo-inositol-1(or 4)-monophosphatase 1 [Trypanosoma conorhini]RNE97720.1 myo-inositol-1(or 4)-monophosphatase 1 [Trypanosoma conorhini]
MPISEAELDVAVELALRAAHFAALIIDKAMLERESALMDFASKATSVDLVTQYDKQCEEEVLTILRTTTPHYDILSEETHSSVELSDKPTWVVDPIDGTTSFIHGLFDCCVSIALVVDKEPVLGVVSAPRLHEVYSAVRGRGAYCNGQRIHVSERRTLQESVVLLHVAVNRTAPAVNSYLAMQKELACIPVHAVRCHGSAALDMCFVAGGRAELYFEVGTYAWDIAAAAVIVREAGGVVHNIDNAEFLDIMSRGFCCANSLGLSRLGMELSTKHNYKEATLGI